MTSITRPTLLLLTLLLALSACTSKQAKDATPKETPDTMAPAPSPLEQPDWDTTPPGMPAEAEQGASAP